MINTEIEKKGGRESTKDTMKQEEEKILTIPLIEIKKIGIGTIQRTKEMNTKERENTSQMIEVIVSLHPKKMITIKDMHQQERNLPNFKK